MDGLALDQEGPGRYRGRFHPEQPGVYLVRARAGADVVSAGLVHSVAGEACTGRIETALLEEATRITGGAVLRDATAPPPAARPGHARYEEAQFLPLSKTILGRNGDHMAALGVSMHMRRVLPGVMERFGHRI